MEQGNSPSCLANLHCAVPTETEERIAPMARHPSCDEMTAFLDVRTLLADLHDSAHQQAVLLLIDAYSRDHYGDGKPLDPDIKARLIAGLQKHPTTEIILAFANEAPAGIAVCFLGFSTFAAKPLLNIHDFAVAPEFRRRGIARQLLNAIEARARELGCCKLTLEVLDKNEPALRAYKNAGFVRYTLQEGAGEAIFLTKPI